MSEIHSQQFPSEQPNPYPVIDAYCHIGRPRFGTVEDALTTLKTENIDYGVLVLGPDVPDYATLFHAMAHYPDRVRGVGIPFGKTRERIRESVVLQVMAGVLGLRIQEESNYTDPVVLETLGRSGRWVYGINILHSAERLHTLLDWLDTYPDAHLAAPHFLRPGPFFDGSTFDGDKRALLNHPRFYPIFSRHGGVGSREPYPHADLRPWVEPVLEIVGWDRVLWGSEYPVYYWRNEQLASTRDWLQKLLPEVNPMDIWNYLGRNAARAILSKNRPDGEPVEIPRWVEQEFDQNRTVPLFQESGLAIGMQDYERLHREFVETLKSRPETTFAEYIIQRLR